MEKDVFKFHVQNLSFGWCRVLMHINDKEIYFNASYVGVNPLASMIDACESLMEDPEKYHVVWQKEPGELDIKFHLDDKKQLHIDVYEKSFVFDAGEEKGEINDEWHEIVPFEKFVSSIVSEGFRVLNAFGLYGYRCSWQDHEDFPLTNLLRITKQCEEMWQGDSCRTDISKEIECLQKYISQLKITQETKMERCTIYYESWQIQCCGEPISVGDHVEWTCVMPKEEHHGFATHSVTGEVTKIIAERSEFPKGQREVWYERAKTIQEEIQHANGWESDLKDDDETDRTFWGYIVEMKDATIKPLKK